MKIYILTPLEFTRKIGNKRVCVASCQQRKLALMLKAKTLQEGHVFSFLSLISSAVHHLGLSLSCAGWTRVFFLQLVVTE